MFFVSAYFKKNKGHGQEFENKFTSLHDELLGRMKSMSELQNDTQGRMFEALRQQERALSVSLDQKLSDVIKNVNGGLDKTTLKTQENLNALKERLAVIDHAQKNISELSKDVVGLQEILSNKQARGAFGELQLEDLVKAALPAGAYDFQVTMGNGKRADCVIKLPNPPGSIVVDAKYPLEDYRRLVDAATKPEKDLAARQFKAAVMRHVTAISEKYIIPNETADSALMFLPSESVYMELHTNFLDVLDASYKLKVWIVSPTTLMATLNTVRAILKDAKMREQAGLIQQEVQKLMVDLGRLDQRVNKLGQHFSQASEDIRQIQISTEKVARRGERIEMLELDDHIENEQLEAKSDPVDPQPLRQIR